MGNKDNTEIVMGKIIEAQQLLDKLESMIVDDDKVSKDEIVLLKNVRGNLEQYKEKMDEAMSDNTVSDEEYRIIHVLEKKIIQDASSIAFADGIVSDDEKAILTKIIDIFKSINE